MAVTLITISTGVLLYAYILYPLFIFALASLRTRRSLSDESFQPRVSIIISAYNEELHLEQCLDSLLIQNYPTEKIEILIGSDGSSDRTNTILANYAASHSSLKPHLFESRRGKMQVLNDLISEAQGEILLFVDADMTLSPDSLTNHVRHYIDKEVGGVAGIYRIVSDVPTGIFGSENDYQSYEMLLRKNESLIHSTVGLSGGNYSIRKELWKELPSDEIHDDLFSVYTLLESGKRILFEPSAISTERFVRSVREEFRRKARFASRGFATLKFFPELLSPQAGLVAVMIWSHKILRWISPFLLAIIFATTIVGTVRGYAAYFSILLVIELVGILIAMIGWVLNTMAISVPVVRQIFWFVAMNLAFMLGTMRYLFGKDEQHWVIATRAGSSSTISAKEQEVHS